MPINFGLGPGHFVNPYACASAMLLFVKLAWRNIWRNKRRSILTVAAVGFAIAVTIITRAMQYGTYERMIIDTVELFSGHFQIQSPGYQQHQTLGYSFPWNDSLMAVLGSVSSVKSYAPRMRGVALVGAGENTTGVEIVGISPEREQQVTTLNEHIQRGAYLGSGPRQSLIGEKLGERLQVDVGDTLVAIAQGYDGSLGSDLFVVRGVFKTGIPELDVGAVVIPLTSSQSLFSMDDRLTELAVDLSNFDKLERVVVELRRRLNADNYAVLPWNELMPELVQLIGFDKAGGTFFILVLIVVVGFGILNTVLMMVLERTREFGVMMSIGMRPNRLFGLIVLEAFLISLSGLATGVALGAGVGGYMSRHPIPLPSSASVAMEAMGFKAFLYSTLTPSIFYESATLIVVLTVVVSIFPALRASRLRPVEALRHV